MSRSMWILAALIGVMTIVMIYQERSGGIDRPWAQSKESLVQQMFSDQCTPVTGGLRAPGAPRIDVPAPDQPDRPVGEIKLK